MEPFTAKLHIKYLAQIVHRAKMYLLSAGSSESCLKIPLSFSLLPTKSGELTDWDTSKLKTFSEVNSQTSENQIAFWMVTLDQGAKILISQSEKCGLKISNVMISWHVLEKWKWKGYVILHVQETKKLQRILKYFKHI